MFVDSVGKGPEWQSIRPNSAQKVRKSPAGLEQNQFIYEDMILTTVEKSSFINFKAAFASIDFFVLNGVYILQTECPCKLYRRLAQSKTTPPCSPQ